MCHEFCSSYAMLCYPMLSCAMPCYAMQVNGETMQDANTSDFIHNVGEIIAFLSQDTMAWHSIA